ncbi:LOW QUALITY PROTEIN: MAX dimerization protein MGA a [Lates calcarifer]|uniref:LOW QUALITY PROTEIN: MAX dimerization protein MGA a n=1 Tax=Lates calcarifer TaxID=8187 RepID=A0AAJ8DLR2_LATCA|nr:LOW QUALITY PROTEIN: MAX dimerization protein MGA a [Lates calcarifer]
MASKKKQKGMVFHHEGATTPAAAPAASHPPACFVVPKPGKASEGGMERSTPVTNEEAGVMGKPNMYPLKEAVRTTAELPAVKHPTSSNPQSENLSPDSICRGIRVTLDNNSMWNEFFRCKTEMILTKQGSRMFPYCRFHISGLQPSRKYSLIMDIQPLDHSRYKWTGKSWQVAGKAECHVKSQPFAHPESPSTGQHWMQNPVSFYKLKLTNNISDQEGNTILHPLHCYMPRLHVVQTDKAAKDIKLQGPGVVTFTFPQTEFMAVTAYQNSRFAQLKVDYNPFVKGLKEDGSSSWGLKLKLNSGKDSHKDGGTTTNKQHPVKKSLKSLLANHKPRSSKAADFKPLVSGDFQKNSTPNKDQSAAKVPEESSCSSSRPAQKLFSELIREAHVSLQRCNLEQLGITSHRTELINTKTTALKSNREDVPEKDSVSVKTQGETSPANKSDTFLEERGRKIKEDKHLLNSPNCKGSFRTDEVNNVSSPVVSQNSHVDSDHQPKPEAPSEVNVKQHKRPAPLPLPALALFLKQHSTKSKKAKSKLDSPPPAHPSDSPSGSLSSAAASACLPSNHSSNATGPSTDLTGDVTKSDNQASGCTGADVHPSEMISNVTGQVVETTPNAPNPSCLELKGPRTEGHLASVLVSEGPGSDLTIPDGTPVLPNSDQPSCTLGTTKSTISSTLATSSVSPVLSPPFDTVLPALNSPQTPTITESSTLPLDSPTRKSDSLLPDPECSSFGFEPLSPASSPEPLPPLPASLALELDSTTCEPTPQPVPPEELPQSEDSTASVFKWHTVLPLPEPYIDASFSTFQPTSQALPLPSITPPLLPSLTPSNPEQQSLDTSTPPPDSAPSFQENEQSLPFPGELSPLTLQLPLSPTFSSLDGDGLSPTPSLTDLVHFFSTNDDLGMGVEFSNTEVVAVTLPPPTTVEANAHEPSQQVQPIPTIKPCKRKKSSRRRKLTKLDMDQKIDDSTYISMQPNLEEVEEQLFISFTSKEALKLHIADSSEGTVTQPQATPEDHLTQPADTPERAESLEQSISACEQILLRDLKLMKHKQVIHPVLQEVGLKMNLLDPTLAIDLQYLGVRLPIPPPGVSLEPLPQELPPSQGVCAAFVSRTGKTTDVTQIKGWREKFIPSEAPSTPSSARAEAGPSSDLQKKNLSAFCSDMLDEYLENEGKLIDERAASFSQPLMEPVVYELPTRSTSYVRTLDSVLKKHSVSSPTTDLISGFIPPSKRPRLSLKETKTSRRGERKQRGPKQTKLRPESAPVATLEPAESNLVPKQAAVQTPPSEHTAPVTEPHKSKKNQLKVRFNHTGPLTFHPQSPAFKRRRKLKPKTSSQTLSPSRSTAPPLDLSGDLAPLESDSELGADQGDETQRDVRPLMTRALLRQKDLEDGVVWEGRARTSITEERAAIALTSLFTLMGFVSENPTAPIQLIRRRASPCLNEFCRLGCVCSSLSHVSKVGHCGRPSCMFGCSCLKQKVVLLKNLDGSDSSPSHHGNSKRRRRRRMKMAYILKEADSVTQPAERVRTLWKRDIGDSDPDPLHIPEPGSLRLPSVRTDPAQRTTSSSLRLRHESRDQTVSLCLQEVRERSSSCARVRGYSGRRRRHKLQENKDLKSKPVRLKPLKHLTLKTSPPPGEPPPPPPPPPPSEPPPKPSKRLIILAECKWASDADRSHVLQSLCEAMAQDRLDAPFWIRDYLISPISQSVEESGADRCIQYEIHISRPRVEPERPAIRPEQEGDQGQERPQQQEHLRQVNKEAEPLEDWQREVEEGDIQEEEEGPAVQQVEEGRERSGGKMRIKTKKRRRRMVSMALPFLTGISPAGFLLANRKQPGGTDHLVQVNGKLYPLAKIQLGKMGALHPANRLAAYLTGRVGSNRKQQGSSSSTKPPQTQTSGPTPKTVTSSSSDPAASSSTTPPGPRPASVLTSPPSTVLQPTAVLIDQSAAASGDPPTGEAPEGVRTQVVAVKVYPSPAAGGAQVRAAPVAPGGSTPSTASQVSGSVLRPVNPSPGGSQVLVQVPGPCVEVPLWNLTPPSSTGQRMVLKPVLRPAPGVQYYRVPDGKLVQLVPLSQVTPVRPNLRVHKGPSSPSVLPPASSTVTTPSSSSSSFRSQRGTCTFKILPSDSRKEPIIITCPKLPPQAPTKVVPALSSFTLLQPRPRSSVTPVNLISLKPSGGRGAELGVKTVAVSAVPVGPGQVPVLKPAPPQTSSSQTPAEKTHRATPPPLPPLASEVTPVSPPHPPAEPGPGPSGPGHHLCGCNTELVTTEKRPTEVVDLVESSSGETENSSDFGDESGSEEEKEEEVKPNHRHNALERRRRIRIQQLFDGLRRVVGLMEEKASKISTLKKAVQVIQELRTTDADLQQRKRRLMKRREELLSIITPPADEISSERGETGADLMEEDLSEETVDSSDEDRVTRVTRVHRVDGDVSAEEEGEVPGVAMETVENSCQNQRRKKTMKSSENNVKTMVEARSVSAAFRSLSSVMNSKNCSKRRLLEQARQQIQTMQTEMVRLKSLKIVLNQQRNTYIREISQRSGKSEQRVLRKLQHLSSKQKKMEEQQRYRAANQLSAAVGGVASDPPTGDTADDDIILTSSNLQQTPQAPHTPVSAPPTAASVQTPVQQSQRILQVSMPVPARPTVSHNAPVVRDRPRTIPNILSRSKNPAPPSSLLNKTVDGEAPSFRALVPAEVLSLVGAALPGQQVLTLSPLVGGPAVLQTTPTPGVASVTLNIPSLTNQQIHVTSLPRPPTGKIDASSAPLMVTNLTASNVNNLLHLVQPAPPPLPAPPLLVSAGSDLIRDQDRAPSQTDTRPESSSSAGLSPNGGVEVGGPLGLDRQPETESLTSLLDELVFLNQQTVSTATTDGVSSEADAIGGRDEDLGHAHSPWLLQLDSDSDTITTETEEAGFQGHAEMSQTGTANENTKGGVLTPPPLLQMKVGGDKIVDPASSDGVAGGGGGRGVGRAEGGGAWRPMPRLVPLGLRGNPSS